MAVVSRTEFKIFLCFFLIYALFSNYIGWNEDSRIFLTISMMDYGSVSIDHFASRTGDRAIYNGHYYSEKAPGSSLLGMPLYAIYKLFFGRILPGDLAAPAHRYMLLVFLFDLMSALFSAATAVILYRMLRQHTQNRRKIFIALAAYGFSAVIFFVSTLYLGHSEALFFSVLSYYLLELGNKNKRKSFFFFSGLSMGCAVLIDYITFLLAAFFIGYAFLRHRARIANLASYAAGTLIFACLFFSYNFLAFGSPLSVSYNYVDSTVFDNAYSYMPIFGYCNESSFTPKSVQSLINYGSSTCHFSETVIYSPGLNSVVAAYDTKGEGYSLIGHVFRNYTIGDYWLYRYNYSTQNGIMPLYEKIVYNGTEENERGEHMSFLVYNTDTPDLAESWWLSSEREVSGHTENMLFQYGRSFLSDECWIYNPLSGGRFLNLSNASACSISFRTRNGRGIYDIAIRISSHNVTADSPETFILQRDYSVTNRKFLGLWIPNKIIMLLFYPYRGFFFFEPVFLLSVAGLIAMRRKHPALSLLIALIFFSLLLLNSMSFNWWGGSSYGPRFLSYALPFLAIALVFSMEILPRKLAYVLLILSLLITLAGQQQLGPTQTNIDVINNRIIISDSYYDDMSTLGPVGSPIQEYYLPKLIAAGPSNIMLKKVAGINLGFFNVPLFAAAILCLWMILKNDSRHS